MNITDFLKNKVDQSNSRHTPSTEQYEIILPRFEEEKTISKNLFQICLHGKESCSSETMMAKLPPAFVQNIDKLKKNNPEYRYRLFCDHEAELFIAQFYGTKILNYYRRIDDDYLAAKADFLRYLLLYAEGGVYLDLKSTIDLSLSETIRESDRFLIFYWDNMPNGNHHCLIPEYIPKGEMLQGFIISSRGNVLLREVILNVLNKMDGYNPYKDGVGWTGTLNTTGPVIYTETLYKATQKSSNKFFFREGKPFSEFGYKVYFSGHYTQGTYQKTLSLKDYRKSSRPVIICSDRYLQKINLCWLKLLSLYQKYFIELKK